MKRLLTSVLTLAALVSISAGAASAGHMKSAMHHKTMSSHSCPAGQHWVKGYMRAGKKVHGYCHKA
ncbi:MAG TPA: hypothetical protein VIG51_01925 [Candidatus Baltobacteraceae bacterium]|jgi:CxxC motif-containing protein